MDDQNGTAGGSDAQPLKLVSPRSKPAHPLPTDRVSVRKQIDLLRGYGIRFQATSGAVSSREVTSIVKMHPTTVGLATPFLVDAKLLVKVGQQGFTPSSDVLAFTDAYRWNPETAPTKLAPPLSRMWFATALLPELDYRGVISLDTAVTKLAEAARADPQDRPRLVQLVDFMAAVGLVGREGDQVKRGSAAPDGPAPGDEQPAAPASPDGGLDAITRQPAPAPNVATALQMAAGAVRFNVQVNVDLAEFSGWSPDRITAFFGGIAAVLAAKAAVERSASQPN